MIIRRLVIVWCVCFAVAGMARAADLSVPLGFEQTESAAARFVTFGHVFAKGTVRREGAVAFAFGNTRLAAQLDAKVFWTDGSVRHGILTVPAPPLAKGAPFDGLLVGAGTPPPGRPPAVDPAALAALGTTITLDLPSGPMTIALADMTAQGKPWLHGPYVTETRLVREIDPHLALLVDVRLYADGTARLDVILERASTYTPGAQTISYGLTVAHAGTTLASHESIAHYPHARVRETVWLGPAGGIEPRFDLATLVATGAVPSYDGTIEVPTAAIARDEGRLTQGGTGPLGWGYVERQMSATGMRDDLGLLPQWAVKYLLTMSPRAKRVMIAHGNVAASIPWHFRDERTGAPVRIDERPKLWIDYRGKGPGYGRDQLPEQYKAEDYGWGPDKAHQPSLSYLPYLVTGDRFHLEELLFQASWSLASIDPDRRNPGLVVLGRHPYLQVRGSGWLTRTLSEVAFIAPSGDPWADFARTILEDNIRMLHESHAVKGLMADAGELEGFFDDLQTEDQGNIRPWMHEYFVLALDLAGRRGIEGANALVRWTQGFHTGRFTSAEKGYDPMRGPTYTLVVMKPDGRFYDTWAAVSEATFGRNPPYLREPEGYPALAIGYTASGLSTLAMFMSTHRSPDAAEGYALLMSYARELGAFKAGNPEGFAQLPGWGMVPRFVDGTVLSPQSYRRGGSLEGTPDNDLLYGNGGRNTIRGGAGNDVVFGDAGDDELDGGVGDDFLVGGPGTDRLVAGPGADALKGGPGADTFVLAVEPGTAEIISDFDPADDQLVLTGVDAAAIERFRASAKPVPEPRAVGTILTLPGGYTLRLDGVSPAAARTLQITLGG